MVCRRLPRVHLPSSDPLPVVVPTSLPARWRLAAQLRFVAWTTVDGTQQQSYIPRSSNRRPASIGHTDSQRPPPALDQTSRSIAIQQMRWISSGAMGGSRPGRHRWP